MFTLNSTYCSPYSTSRTQVKVAVSVSMDSTAGPRMTEHGNALNYSARYVSTNGLTKRFSHSFPEWQVHR